MDVDLDELIKRDHTANVKIMEYDVSLQPPIFQWDTQCVVNGICVGKGTFPRIRGLGMVIELFRPIGPAEHSTLPS